MQPDKLLISKEDIKKKIRDISNGNGNTVCIILGAGASFGYCNDYSYKPPVVKNLFDEDNLIVNEIINSPEHISIKTNRQHYVDELQNYNNDLEKYLSFLYSRNNKDNLFSNLVTYLQDIYLKSSQRYISEPNNYRRLINIMWEQHGDKRWSCISFNYDTLLEKSFIESGRDPNGRSFDSFESYVNYNPVVLKMHGGVNFRYAHVKQNNYNDARIRIPNYTLFSNMMSNEAKWPSGFAVVLHPNSDKPDHHREAYLGEPQEKFSLYDFPLMLIPIHASITPENVFFGDMINRARDEIKKSNLIISIGYNFGDKSFTDSFKNIDFSHKEIILVSTINSVNDIQNFQGYKNLKESNQNLNIKVFNGDGFKEFVAAII